MDTPYLIQALSALVWGVVLLTQSGRILAYAERHPYWTSWISKTFLSAIGWGSLLVAPLLIFRAFW
jgi:hypothetical protein